MVYCTRQKSRTGEGMLTDYSQPGFYNADCMDAMRQFPDQFFDLAIVDPPYGNGNSEIGGGCGSEESSAGIRWNRFGQRFDRYKQPVRTGGTWAGKYAKKSLRGMLPRINHILMNCSAFHAIKLFGVEIISICHRQGVFWFGKS